MHAIAGALADSDIASRCDDVQPLPYAVQRHIPRLPNVAMTPSAKNAGSAPDLEVRNLAKRFTPQSVVGPLTFSVAAGEFVSLLGPSGCGKTTTLRCIAGFETPSEGSILLDGRSIEAQPPNRRNIGLVFQNYALFPHLTIFENIAFGLRLRRVGDAELQRRVRNALELVGLPDLARRYPRQLSGGQQQRIAIARSVVLEPRILLFDEPLSNLDLKLRVSMRKELRELQRRLGKSTVYVTHDQGEALALSDRIVVMSNGRIEQIGTPREIYERPANAFVADFIGSSNLFDAVVERTERNATIIRTDRGVTLRAASVTYAAGDRVVAMVRPERIRFADADEPEGDNRLTVHLKEATFLGQDLQLSLGSDNGQELIAVTQGSAAVRVPATGGVVVVTIDAADILLLPK
jgi:putative spermidine/putrescine transport system ATP-binding protein